MVATSNSPAPDVPLNIRLDGPGVREGRILLVDLVQFGERFQKAVDRVAQVLAGATESDRPGRRPEHIRAACALEVVAVAPGSFELALDFRRDQTSIAGLDPGEQALEALLRGLQEVVSNDHALPVGYDPGVLAAWRDVGKILSHGIETIQFDLRTRVAPLVISYDAKAYKHVVDHIQAPVTNLRTVEGRLLMADFKETGTRCRIHPPAESPVVCEFDESLAEVVQDSLRSYVRATGEAEHDPHTGRIRQLKITDIEILEVDADSASLGPEDFWREPSLEELAAEQGVVAPQRLDDLIGAEADLWDDDDQFEAFLAGIYRRRRESREREDIEQ